jgi:predicted DNA-binding transcriptional regulator AlpA
MHAQTMQAQPSSKLLTARDVAEILACSIRHVWRLDSAGTLRRVNVAGLVRFRQSDIENLIREGK